MCISIKHGATRTVVLTRKLAIKIPYIFCWKNFLYGILANMQEAEFSKLKHPLLCPVLFKFPLGLFIVMPKADVQSQHMNDWLLLARKDADCELLFNIVEQKDDSIGLLNGQLCAVDYGT